jgi:hypothetical protein
VTEGPTLTRDWAGPVAAGLVAVVVVSVVGRAWLAGTNDPDSMNSVLYFQRILGGERLEVTVLTTPKPLLTVLYGASWDLFHDWRTLVWLTIAAHGVGVAASVRLATRLAGVAAGAFHGGLLTFDPSRVPLFVPGPFLGRIAVELDVELTQLGDNAVAFLSAAPSRVLRPGQEIYHDAVLDAPPATFRALEVIEPTSIGSLRVVPLDVRPGAYWLLRVER